MIYKGKTELFEIHLSERDNIYVLFEPISCKYHKANDLRFESYEAAECYAQDLEEKYKG